MFCAFRFGVSPNGDQTSKEWGTHMLVTVVSQPMRVDV